MWKTHPFGTTPSYFRGKKDFITHKICPLGINSSSKYLDYISLSKQYIAINNVKSHFNVLYLNIRSLNANFNKLNEMITCMQIKPDIIGVSETWITQNRPFIFQLKDYKSLLHSGGVAFFVLNCHNFYVLD